MHVTRQLIRYGLGLRSLATTTPACIAFFLGLLALETDLTVAILSADVTRAAKILSCAARNHRRSKAQP